jgi:hypothetical protein
VLRPEKSFCLPSTGGTKARTAYVDSDSCLVRMQAFMDDFERSGKGTEQGTSGIFAFFLTRCTIKPETLRVCSFDAVFSAQIVVQFCVQD